MNRVRLQSLCLLIGAIVVLRRFSAADESLPKLTAQNIVGSSAGQQAVNSIGQVFCWCPPGTFIMGSPENEQHRSYDEQQVEVTLSRGFWISKFEVTEAEYRQVTRRSPRRPLGDNYPLVDTKSGDAKRYADSLTKSEHEAGILPKYWAYALPTEAEWEYACRAGTTTAYSFGDAADSLPKFGNFADRKLLNYNDSEYRYADPQLDDGHAQAAPVGSFSPNAWNIHDMHGNVWEWCQDAYDEILTGGTDPTGAEKGTDRGRVMRGGSWLSHTHYCRSAMRQAHHDLNSAPYIGIRIVLKQRSVE